MDILAGILIVIAVILFWAMGRKNKKDEEE